MGRGKTSRRGVEGVLKGEGGRGLRQGVGPLRKLPCALLVHAEAAAESLLNFSVEHAECEWVKKCRGGGRSGPSPLGLQPQKSCNGEQAHSFAAIPNSLSVCKERKTTTTKKRKKELRPGQGCVKQQSGI